MSTGSYAAVARHLTELFGLSPPMDRRQPYVWSKRGTVNRQGRRFPSPVLEKPSPKRTTPRWEFDLDETARWYREGAPAPYGRGWLN
jgi:hypothetical protein